LARIIIMVVELVGWSVGRIVVCAGIIGRGPGHIAVCAYLVDRGSPDGSENVRTCLDVTKR
jgi:hypothetical protein